jgi:hypothetical protein
MKLGFIYLTNSRGDIIAGGTGPSSHFWGFTIKKSDSHYLLVRVAFLGKFACFFDFSEQDIRMGE